MAFKQAELYYWDSSKWVQALTHSGSNALADTRILEMMGNPVKLGVTLTNFAKDWTSDDPADQRGYLTDVFKDYQQVIVREGETHQILFAGRIYKIDTSYDPQLGGSTIRLEAFDALAELRDFSSSGLKESKYRHFKMSSLSNTPNSVVRSDVIKELIIDSIGASTSGWITNSSSTINVTDYTGAAPRFQNSVKTVAPDDYIEPQKTGHSSILGEISDLAASDPHTSAKADKDMGYNYYVDHNITTPKPTSGNWTANPPAHFNYYKRGSRPNASPEDFGLTVKFGTGARNQTGLPEDTSNQTFLNNQKPQKIMLANYEFNKPSEELFSHAIVTYDSQDQKNDKEQNLVTQFMEVLHVSNIANFANSSNDMFFEERDLFNHDNKPKSFRNPPALLQYKNASNVWTDTGAYVHMATAATSSAVTGSSTVRDYEAILIGYSDEYAAVWDSHMAAMQAIGSGVELRLQLWLESNYTDEQFNFINDSSFENPSSSTPVQGFTTNPTCTFDASTTVIGKGRVRTAYGLNRPKRISIANITGTEALRTSVMSSLYRMNMDLRRGKFTIMGPPYYAIDLEVKTSGSNNLTFRDIANGSETINISEFDIRDGFTIMNFGSDQTFADGNEVSHGQITNIVSSNQIAVSMNNGTLPSIGDYVRIYIPLRAGDFIRVENSQEAVLGNHFITTIDYGERNGSVMTTLSTVGRNEDVALTTSEGIPHDALNIQIHKYASDPFAFTPNTIPYGQRPFEVRGLTFERTDRNTISWTAHPEGAYIKVGPRWYGLVAGNTDNRLAANSQNPMSTTVPSGETTCPVYYIYWDPDESFSVLQVAAVGEGNLDTDYTHDSDNVIIGVARANADSTKLAEFWFYGKSPGTLFELDFYKDDPGAFIADSAMASALQRKGTQPFSSNIGFNPAANVSGGEVHVTGHHLIDIVGKNQNGSESSGTSRVIEFTDGKTATMDASITSLNISAGENTGTGSVLWYIYFDLSTGLESSGNYTAVDILATTDYSIVNTDDRGLLALAAVSTDYSQAVAIQTFSSKIGNINADNIAANSITANAIKTGSIETDHISGTLGGGVITVSSETTFTSGWDDNLDIGGNVTFEQEAIPTTSNDNAKDGDLWIRTGSSYDNLLYRAKGNTISNIVTNGSGWYIFDIGLAEYKADAAQTTANDKRKTFTGSSIPASTGAGDIWINYTDQKIYIAQGQGTGTGGVPNNVWSLRDDAGAINNADTSIYGGRIMTQAIVLKEGGSITNTPVLQGSSTDPDGEGQGSGTRVLLHHDGIFGYNGTTTQFSLETADGVARAGAGKIVLDSRGIHVLASTASLGSAAALRFSYGNNLTNALSATNYIGLRINKVDGGGTNGFTRLQWHKNISDTVGMNFNMMQLHAVGGISGSTNDPPSTGSVWYPPTTGGSSGDYLKISSGSGTVDTPYTTVWDDPLDDISTHSHSTSHSLDVNNIYLNGHLYNNGDTNTYMRMYTDHISFFTGGYYGIDISESSNVVNIGMNIGYSTSYNLKLSGNAAKTTSGSWLGYSDDRIKEEIASITNGTSLIKSLNPVTYTHTDAWLSANPEVEDRTYHGFLASEFETVLPKQVITSTEDLIKLSDNSYQLGEYSPKVTNKEELPDGASLVVENIKTISDDLTAYIVAAIKELDARITALES